MKVLLLSLLVMAPLYLLFCKAPPEPVAASHDTAVEAVEKGELGTGSTHLIPLKPYQQQLEHLEQAKSVETMLNQGLKNRMRAIEDVDSEN
jgi:hypothetical protein